MDTLLEMRNISKRFPGVLALSDVNFNLREGEVHVLLGENGAGKSTLIKILSGAYSADEGDIFIQGEKVHISSPRDALRLGISAVHQELNLVPYLTVSENMFLGREFTARNSRIWLDDREQQRQAKDSLARMGFSIDHRAKVSSLIFAEKQLVAIARSLSRNVKILILDEPTSGLSDDETERLFETIKMLKDKGIGIIYISHRLEEVTRLADQITVLRDGRYIATRPKDESVDNLITLMVGEAVKNKFPKLQVEIGDRILDVKNLTKAGHFSNVSFSLSSGEILGIGGLVGSGRSSLLESLYGALPYEEGNLEIFGKQLIKGDTITKFISYGTAYLPSDRQTDGIIPSLSVRDNLLLSASKLFVRYKWFLDGKKELAEARRYVNQLNIKTPGLDTYIKYLSGGNQQKTLIARGLCQGSKIFLLEEPTRGIDVAAKVEIYKIIGQMVRDGGSVILSSSEIPELLGVSDRILVMHRGRITGELTREQATQERILKLAFGHIENKDVSTATAGEVGNASL